MIKSKKLPKIIFRHSWIYDRIIERLSGNKNAKPRSRRFFINRINKFYKEWDNIGNKILEELSRITKLKWHENEINVYITDGVIPFSDPLTLNLKSNIHTLTHELIHRILSQWQNGRRFEKNWKRLMSKYEKEILKASRKLKVHIIVHAIHWHIIDKFFGDKILQKEMKAVKHVEDYVRSWEIVKSEGHKEIIKKLTEGF